MNSIIFFLLFFLNSNRPLLRLCTFLLQVDLFKRHCFPVYWSGENWRVLKAHWFARKGDLDWLPLREDIAEQLELAYRCQVRRWEKKLSFVYSVTYIRFKF